MQPSNRTYRRSIGATGFGDVVFRFLPALCFIFSLFLFPASGQAQALSTVPTDIPLPEPVFNKQFIKENKIKLVRKSIVDKPDGEIIRDKGLAENFLYDENGNLIKHFYNDITSLMKTEVEVPAVVKHGRVIKKGYTKIDYKYQYDTLSTDYAYTSNGFLVMKRRFAGDFYNTTYYEYMGDGFLSRRIVCKETNKAKYGEPFQLGVQTILSDEKFEYENLTPTQVKKVFLNDEGKPYKKGILNFANGKITDESYEFVVGFIRSGVTYTYDAAGRLTEKISTDNSSGSSVEKIAYEYDSNGNVTKEKKFKNGTQTDEVIYLYENDKKLLSSQADRQIQKESIKIVKYEYEFYP